MSNWPGLFLTSVESKSGSGFISVDIYKAAVNFRPTTALPEVSGVTVQCIRI